MTIPVLFMKVHQKEIDELACSYQGMQFNIGLREPWRPIDLELAWQAASAVVQVVRFHCTNRSGQLVIHPLTKQDQEAIDAWYEKYKHHTADDFLVAPWER